MAFCGITAGAGRYRPLVVAPLTSESTPSGIPWRGAVHVHSDHSDGTGSVEEIAAAAAVAGLDFIVLTDHTRAVGPAGRARRGWYGDVLVIIGEEISTEDGHVLALGTESHDFALGPTARQAMRDIHQLGGAALIAHPLASADPWSAGWGGTDGVEVVNLAEAWWNTPGEQRPKIMLDYLRNPSFAILSMLASPSGALSEWDRRIRLHGGVARPRPLAAVGAVDAHGPIEVFGPLQMPSYEAIFAALSQLVWMDTAPVPDDRNHRSASKQIVERLRAGRSTTVVDAVGSARGFHFFGRRGDSLRRAHPGDVRTWGGVEWTLKASMGGPGHYRIVLLRDGQEVGRSEGDILEQVADAPGTYRVEVYRTDGPYGAGWPGSVPWVISNPIYLWPSRAIDASVLHPAPEPPPPPVQLPLLLLGGWSAEAREANSDLAGAARSLRWTFRLHDDAPSDAFAALTRRNIGPLDGRGSGGLVLGLRADRALRIRLVLRVGGATDALNTWAAVVSGGVEASRVAVPWARWRQVDPPGGQEGAVLTDDLGNVLDLSLVVTPELLRPGREANVTIMEFGLYGTSEEP